MATISGKTIAWLTRGYDLNNQFDDDSINHLTYYDRDMSQSGWVKVGEAIITVDLIDVNDLVDNQINSLEAEIKEVEGRAYAKVTELKSRIQNLKAITYQETVDGSTHSV